MSKKGLYQIRYNAILLFEIMKSPEVPIKSKAMIAGALGYLILPTDIIPDFVAGIGFTDDLSVLLMLMNQMQSLITEEMQQLAAQKAGSSPEVAENLSI